jgi:hypothetical protein
VPNIAFLKRQLRNDLVELRHRRAIGVHRPVIIVRGGLLGPILHATVGGKVFRWTAWESQSAFIARVTGDRMAGVAFIGGLGRLPGTDTIMPL